MLVLNLRPGPKWYQALVTEKISTNMYSVYIKDLDVTWRRHVQQLLPLPSDQPLENDSIPIPVDEEENTISNSSKSTPPIQPSKSPSSNSPEETKDSNAGIESPTTILDPSLTLRRSTRIRKPVDRYGF